MNSKFFDIKKEKQDRMINAALKVFAQQGYRHGSTDDIVREAAVSKGLLFHYFGSKLELYRFIYDYSVRYMNLELRSCVDMKETDLFALMKQMESAKMHAMKGYPYMQQFLNRPLLDDSLRRCCPWRRRRTPWKRLTPKSTAKSTTKPFRGSGW